MKTFYVGTANKNTVTDFYRFNDEWFRERYRITAQSYLNNLFTLNGILFLADIQDVFFGMRTRESTLIGLEKKGENDFIDIDFIVRYCDSCGCLESFDVVVTYND